MVLATGSCLLRASEPPETQKGYFCQWLIGTPLIPAARIWCKARKEKLFGFISPGKRFFYTKYPKTSENLEISFRINRIESPIQPTDSDCGESLTLYDASWADDSKIIKTFCDTFSKAMEKYNFVSTGNSLFVKFESQTGSYSGWVNFNPFIYRVSWNMSICSRICPKDV